MAELIITDAQGVDRESVADYKLDSAWGSDENDFELTVSGRLIESGSYVYLDGGECGGVVDALKDSLKRGESTLTYSGRTWHGMLANKILAPDSGKDYLTVSGSRLGHRLAHQPRGIGCRVRGGGFATAGAQTIKSYQFDRYVDAYTGLRKMCAANGLKLKLAYASGQVNIWAEPIAHYGDSIDSDLIDFDATRTWRKPNHMIGLGKGDLAARTVVHWYADTKAMSANPNRSRAWTR